VTETIRELEEQMLEAANELQFEKAALYRDQVRELKRGVNGGPPETGPIHYPKGKRRKSRA